MELIEAPATVRLTLDSTPECLTLVRGMLAGIAELLGLDAGLLDDVKTAVSEACNNVVLHAYGGEPGPLAVRVTVEHDRLEVMVRDWGGGIRYVASSEDRMGVGLAVISALAERAEFVSAADGGTEVRMAFPTNGARVRSPDRPADAVRADDPGAKLSGDAVVSLSPVALLAGVLGRLARAFAARAQFSLDRFSDVYLVADVLANYAQSAASSSRIEFALVAHNRRIQLTIGPFRPGSGAQLQPDETRAGTELRLGRIADELTVEAAADTEMLRVVLMDSPS